MRFALALALAALAGCLYWPSPSVAAGPPNDNYLASTTICRSWIDAPSPLCPSRRESGVLTTYRDLSDTTGATTQPDLFNPDASGQPLGGAGPEPTTCNGVSYGKTVWYDFWPRIPGEVQIEGLGLTTAIAVYQFDPRSSMIVRRVECQVSTDLSANFDGSNTDNVLPLLTCRGLSARCREVQPHKAYTVQIGGLATPSGFDSGLLDFRLRFLADHDGDGVPDFQDACPTLAGTLKDGCPPALHPQVSENHVAARSGIVLTNLLVHSIPGGVRVEARCKQCGLHQVIFAAPPARSVTITSFIGRTLPLGAKLELWVTKRRTRSGPYQYGAIGSYIRYTVGSGGLGSSVGRCLLPGSRTPRGGDCHR